MNEVRHRPHYRYGASAKTARVSIAVSPELLEAMDEAAEAAGLALGAWVREVIEDTLSLDECELA